MTSDQKRTSNRANAKKSTGPKSALGKQRAAQNALRHGLAIPVGSVAALQEGVERLALGIATASGEKVVTASSRQAAEAELDMVRIRKARAAVFNSLDNNAPATEGFYDKLNESLASLDRYERRAFSRHKRAFRALF
jgi:hypothetical protein